MTDAYRDDLAYIHDAGFGALARHAATALIADLNDRSMLSGTVVDLGCGSGITAEVLADAGYHVLGVDLSEPLIRIARARVPTAEFRVGSFVDMEIPPCIAVTAIGEVLNYLFDPHNGESARSPLFNKIYAALRPSGLFMFDLATPKRKPEGGVSRSFTESTDWTVLVQIDAEPDSNILRRQITTFRRVGALFRRDQETHRLQLLDVTKIKAELEAIGFTAKEVGAYGALTLPKGLTGLLAYKP